MTEQGTRDGRGWLVYTDEFFMTGANLERRGVAVEVDIDADGITVTAEEGSGPWNRDRTRTHIPMDVLRGILAHVGLEIIASPVQSRPRT